MNESIHHALKTGRLIVTAGAGGVGKTTIAAALAINSTISEKRRVAVVTIDPARRLANAMGFESLSGDLKAVSLDELNLDSEVGALHAMMLDVKTTSDAMVRRFAPDRISADAILANGYYRQFAGALSGSQEYMAVEAVRSLLEDDQFDLVVLDTPPAIHALDFFDAPRRLIDGLDSVPMRMLSQYGAGAGQSLPGRIARKGSSLMLKGLGRMAGGPFLEELSEFLRLFGHILEALKQASVALEALFRQDGVHFFLVLTPQQGDLKSALRFKTELSRRNLPFKGFILNKVQGRNDLGLMNPQERVSALLEDNGFDLDVSMENRIALETFFSQEAALANRDSLIANRLERTSEFPVVCVPSMNEEVHDLASLLKVSEALTCLNKVGTKT